MRQMVVTPDTDISDPPALLVVSVTGSAALVM